MSDIVMQVGYRFSDRADTYCPVDPDEAAAIVRAFVSGQPIRLPDNHKPVDNVKTIRFFEDR